MFDLKRFRKDKKLTQNEIAFIFNCGQSNIAAIEREHRDLTSTQEEILIEKFGNIDTYKTNSIDNIYKSNTDNITEDNYEGCKDSELWESLVDKHQQTIEKLLFLLEKEKEEKAKLIETISMLSSALVDKKAV